MSSTQDVNRSGAQMMSKATGSIKLHAISNIIKEGW